MSKKNKTSLKAGEQPLEKQKAGNTSQLKKLLKEEVTDFEKASEHARSLALNIFGISEYIIDPESSRINPELKDLLDELERFNRKEARHYYDYRAKILFKNESILANLLCELGIYPRKAGESLSEAALRMFVKEPNNSIGRSDVLMVPNAQDFFAYDFLSTLSFREKELLRLDVEPQGNGRDFKPDRIFTYLGMLPAAYRIGPKYKSYAPGMLVLIVRKPDLSLFEKNTLVLYLGSEIAQIPEKYASKRKKIEGIGEVLVFHSSDQLGPVEFMQEMREITGKDVFWDYSAFMILNLGEVKEFNKETLPAFKLAYLVTEEANDEVLIKSLQKDFGITLSNSEEKEMKELTNQLYEKFVQADEALKETEATLGKTRDELKETKVTLGKTRDELKETETTLGKTRDELKERDAQLDKSREINERYSEAIRETLRNTDLPKNVRKNLEKVLYSV